VEVFGILCFGLWALLPQYSYPESSAKLLPKSDFRVDGKLLEEEVRYQKQLE